MQVLPKKKAGKKIDMMFFCALQKVKWTTFSFSAPVEQRFENVFVQIVGSMGFGSRAST